MLKPSDTPVNKTTTARISAMEQEIDALILQASETGKWPAKWSPTTEDNQRDIDELLARYQEAGWTVGTYETYPVQVHISHPAKR